MKRRPEFLATVFLTLVWVLLVGRFDWMSLFAGLLVAVVVQAIFPMPPVLAGVRVHPVGLVVLVATFLWDLTRASVWVAWLAVRPRPISHGTVIEVQLTERDDLLRTVIAELTSLVPGTVVVDVNPHSGVMTMHVLDKTEPSDLDAERGRVAALERRVRAGLGGTIHSDLHSNLAKEEA